MTENVINVPVFFVEPEAWVVWLNNNGLLFDTMDMA